MPNIHDLNNKSGYDYFVYNRNTGRDVKVNSKTYQRLIEQGIKFDKPFLKPIKMKMNHKVNHLDNKMREGLPLYSGDISKLSYDKYPPYLQKRYNELIHNKSLKSTHNISRGWSLLSPKKGIQRHKMLQECGPKCFLNPNEEGFPICPYDLENDKPICELSCAGLMAAKRRSAQWGYKNIYDSSTKLYNSKCKGNK